MRRALTPHPDSIGRAATGIEVDVVRTGPAGLTLTYVVSGRIADLNLPPAAPSARADELWRHTCFEAFVRPGADEAYCEFNFAPSTQWAAYRFERYRDGMSAPAEIAAPRIAVQADPDTLIVRAPLELHRLHLSGGPWRLGLAAVIEETNGLVSYWALAHPPGKPDFHHSDCFALELT